MPEFTSSGKDVRVIRPEGLDARTPQTPGLQRYEAISSRLVGAEGLWLGLSVLAPGDQTGIHHHGESETALYVLSGVARWWVGPDLDSLDEMREARAGDFVYIPPHVVHWEGNGSDAEPVEMIVARSTQHAIVVNFIEGEWVTA